MANTDGQPDPWQALADYWNQFAATFATVFTPILDSIVTTVNFTVDHITEIADQLHKEAGSPYGDAPDAGLTWLHDRLKEWQADNHGP